MRPIQSTSVFRALHGDDPEQSAGTIHAKTKSWGMDIRQTDRQTDKQTNTHVDSITDLAQRAELVKTKHKQVIFRKALKVLGEWGWGEGGAY